MTPPPDPCPGIYYQSIPFYRAYNLKTTDHFYTIDINEMNYAVGGGYTYEGPVFRVFASSVAGAVPFYRMYNTAVGDHFYTTSVGEVQYAATGGYVWEGAVAYIFSTPVCGAIPLWRLYHAGIGDHLYTTSVAERDYASVNPGYSQEGIAGYVFP